MGGKGLAKPLGSKPNSLDRFRPRSCVAFYAGLRTPNEEGFALIVSAPAEALFAKGDAPLSNGFIAESKSREIRVRLDRGNGIRDMAALGDGGLLLLTGPATTNPFRSGCSGCRRSSTCATS